MIEHTACPEDLTIQALDPPHVNRVFTELQASRTQGYNVLRVEETLGQRELVYIVEGDTLAVELRLVGAHRLTLQYGGRSHQSIIRPPIHFDYNHNARHPKRGGHTSFWERPKYLASA